MKKLYVDNGQQQEWKVWFSPKIRYVSVKSMSKGALNVKGAKSPKLPNTPSFTAQGTVSARKLNPGVNIKQEFMDGAGIAKGLTPIFQSQNRIDFTESATSLTKHTGSPNNHKNYSEQKIAKALISSNKVRSTVKKNCETTGRDKHGRVKNSLQKRD